MSGFTQSVKKQFQFDGDDIEVELRRLNRADMMKVAPHIPTDGKPPTNEQNMKILDACSAFVGNYVVKFSGLVDEDENPIAFDVVVEEAYFYPLLAEIISWWFEASQMQAASVGKSKGRRRGGGAG